MELGRYRLLAELARGGMGIVHLAEVRGPGGFEKLVVVKELKHELADDPVYCAMFLDEARLAARLSHRHIVQTNEVGCQGGRYFMALELLEGGSLHQIRQKLGIRALPLTMGVRVLVAVLDALHHAHEVADADGTPLGVVHRDVSPQNIFLTFDGDVKLIDFGVAKSQDRRGGAVTQVGVVKGSVPYMSPDHVDGSTIDRRADVFAAGVLLREMITNERFWGSADDLTILRGLIARDLPALPESSSVHPVLRAICERALSPKRADRYATAAAMRDALEAYLAEVDPRGSLHDLGAWLGTALATERTALRELVRKSRVQHASTSATTPGKKSPVWLPSCDLSTRYSGPPILPAAPPPLPAAARKRRLPPRFIGASVALVLALAGTAFGVATSAPVQSPNDPSHELALPAPHLVTGAVTVSTDTSATTEMTNAISETVSTTEPEVTDEAATAAARVPAAVLREVLPPNPYAE